jgi:hypothetical protein
MDLFDINHKLNKILKHIQCYFYTIDQNILIFFVNVQHFY